VAESGGFDTATAGEAWRVTASGPWTLSSVLALEAAIEAADPGPARSAELALAGIERLDTAGAWLIHRWRRSLEARGLAVTIAGAAPEDAALIERVARAESAAPINRPRMPVALYVLNRVGEESISALHAGRDLLGFLGGTLVALGRAIVQPRRLRWVALVNQIEETGLNALPILGLLSFLIGVVLAYQGADQLRAFGAEIYSVNLLAVSVLREIGALLTAIMVAGRSGSAFTAQIGTMKLREEIDAMRTLGLDPMDVLVLPRVVALVLVMPLVTLYADAMALLGGAITATAALDLTIGQFWQQLTESLAFSTFWTGIVKTPVFALLIAIVGCHEGFRVKGGADSVGRQTTRAVVESIFLVIVADAVFSIFFSVIRV